MRYFPVSLLSALLSVCALPAQAREAPPIRHSSPAVGTAPPPDSAPTEAVNLGSTQYAHRGFYLRAELGGGYRSLSAEAGGVKLRVDGGGAGASIIAGGTPLPNLILVGELLLNNIVNPTVHMGDQSAEAKDTSAKLLGIGPGIIYYLMPANVSFGATLLLTQFSVKQGQTVSESEAGFGGALRVGKEWQVSRHAGIGLGGQVALASMKDKGEGAPTWLATAFTLGASFTFN